jgi:acetyl/propionyl-CoA carboxylase alpha subunit
MQDLGGCRAVLSTVEEVDKLVCTYTQGGTAKNPALRHKFIRKKDYISSPKSDGYRSVHLIYGYRSGSKKHAMYSDLKIEIQIRSQLQHAWATASEVVSTFTGQALKSNIGDESWKRFFKLMGSEIALREKRQPVPETPQDREALISELRAIAKQLQVTKFLSGHVQAVKLMTEKVVRSHTYLLILDAEKMELWVNGFTIKELPEAQQRYIEVEKKTGGNPSVQAVLVSGVPIKRLREAYPNYYLDTEKFVFALHAAIGTDE